MHASFDAFQDPIQLTTFICVVYKAAQTRILEKAFKTVMSIVAIQQGNQGG
jgi:hypothetical protein